MPLAVLLPFFWGAALFVCLPQSPATRNLLVLAASALTRLAVRAPMAGFGMAAVLLDRSVHRL